MRLMHLAALLGLISTSVAPTVYAQNQVPQVEAWSLQKTSTLGSAIYLQDFAAARATDALVQNFNGNTPSNLVGWIVVPQGDSQLVRFLTGDVTNPTATYDIPVDVSGKAGAVSVASDTVLPAEQLAQFNARMTAASSFTPTDLRCAERYNAVVLDDPDNDGWLVWLLASTTDANKVPMGGHYRFHISPDGKSIQKREQLSTSCLDLDKGSANAQSVGLVTSVVVAPQPLEVHVFLSLYSRMPVYTVAGSRIWAVHGARITDAGPVPQRQSR